MSDESDWICFRTLVLSVLYHYANFYLFFCFGLSLNLLKSNRVVIFNMMNS